MDANPLRQPMSRDATAPEADPASPAEGPAAAPATAPCDPLPDTLSDPALQRSAAQLAPVFYAELRRIARRVRWGSGASETLQTTALVHESFLKLRATPQWNDRQHFLCAAALAMRQVVVDDLRQGLAQRRGGGAEHLPLEHAERELLHEADEQVLAVDQALQQLAALNPRLARTVECRYFAGYSEAETAEALGVSAATVQRDWAKARAWLKRALADER